MNRDKMLSFHLDYEVRGHARPDALVRYIPALQVTAEAELPPFPSHAGAGDRGKKCHIYKYKPTLVVDPFLWARKEMDRKESALFLRCFLFHWGNKNRRKKRIYNNQ